MVLNERFSSKSISLPEEAHLATFCVLHHMPYAASTPIRHFTVVQGQLRARQHAC